MGLRINKKNIIIFLLVLSISIGFAVLTTTLSIFGTANVKSQSWNVYWSNLDYVNPDGINLKEFTINPKTTLTFSVDLNSPGDMVEFTIDAVNAGTLNAAVENVSISNLTEEQSKYLKFEVKNFDGTDIVAGQELKAESFFKYLVRVEYRTDISKEDLANSKTEAINLSFSVTYKQSNSSYNDEANKARFDSTENIVEKMRNLLDEHTEYDIHYFKRSDRIDDYNKKEENLVSKPYSVNPIYMWYDNDANTMYYYSEADVLYLSDYYSYDGTDAYSTESFFNFFSNAKEIDLDGIDTSLLTTTRNMFRGCNVVSLDLSNFDTARVTDMQGMFSDCMSLKSIKFGSFKTNEVKNMSRMFMGCSSLQNLDLSTFNTSSVTNMESMFSGCDSLTELNISNFNTSNVRDMCYMFSHSAFENIDLNSFDTSKATDIHGMFMGCSNLTTLDLSSFDTSKVENIDQLFNECYSLNTIYVSSKFTTKSLNFEEYNPMTPFGSNDNLVGENGTTFDYEKIGTEYARVDGKKYDSSKNIWIEDSTIKGYFSLKEA